MSATGRTRPRVGSGGDAGATLLEMLVVVALLALATGIVFPNMRRPYARLAAETARAGVVSDLRAARAAAVRGERRVSFAAAVDGRSYGWSGARKPLPAGIALLGSTEPLVFAPDGSAVGGALAILGSDGHRSAIDVDPATGLVRPQFQQDTRVTR